MGHVDIRPCRVDECEAVLALWREAEALESVTDTLEVLEDLVRDGDGRLLVATRDGKLVGSVCAGFDGWRGHVYRLVVAPEERRRGLGRRLVADAEAMLVTLGARRLSITVAGDDPRAVPFWTAMASAGWELDERAIRFVKTLRNA